MIREKCQQFATRPISDALMKKVERFYALVKNPSSANLCATLCAVSQMTEIEPFTYKRVEDYLRLVKSLCLDWNYQFLETKWIYEPVNSYALHEEIGSGTYGNVYKATINQTNLVACKICKRDYASFFREATAMQRLFGSSIFCSPPWFSLRMPRIFTPLAKCSLFHKIYGQEDFSDADIYQWMEQIMMGLTAAHQCGVIHRDVTPSNILLTFEGFPVIIDWGSSEIDVSITEDNRVNVNATTVMYRPPEMFGDSIPFTKQVLESGDIWSVGCVFYEALYAKRIFEIREETTYDEFRQLYLAEMAKFDVMEHLNVKHFPILKRLLHWDPMQRPSAKEAIQLFNFRIQI